MSMNSSIIKPKRVTFPKFELVSYPSIDLSIIENRRFPTKCPVCKQYFTDVFSHAMKETDILHGIYVIHNS